MNFQNLPIENLNIKILPLLKKVMEKGFSLPDNLYSVMKNELEKIKDEDTKKRMLEALDELKECKFPVINNIVNDQEKLEWRVRKLVEILNSGIKIKKGKEISVLKKIIDDYNPLLVGTIKYLIEKGLRFEKLSHYEIFLALTNPKLAARVEWYLQAQDLLPYKVKDFGKSVVNMVPNAKPEVLSELSKAFDKALPKLLETFNKKIEEVGTEILKKFDKIIKKYKENEKAKEIIEKIEREDLLYAAQSFLNIASDALEYIINKMEENVKIFGIMKKFGMKSYLVVEGMRDPNEGLKNEKLLKKILNEVPEYHLLAYIIEGGNLEDLIEAYKKGKNIKKEIEAYLRRRETTKIFCILYVLERIGVVPPFSYLPSQNPKQNSDKINEGYT